METTTTIERPRTLVDAATLASETAGRIARFAAEADRTGTFVDAAYAILRENGFLALGVPAELGGGGATLRELAYAHRALAQACGSTALAASMHSHSVATLAWRHRRGAPVAPVLKRVADEGIIIASTGGGDFTNPSANAVRVEGGWSVNGRKRFVSQAPAAAIMSTWAMTDEAENPILGLTVPMDSPGVSIMETWDTHGMRGTASHDVLLQSVFVPDARAGIRRPAGQIDPLLRIAYINAFAIICGVYAGLVAAAQEFALEHSAARATDDPAAQRLAGLLDYEGRSVAWALEALLRATGDDPAGSMDEFVAVMQGKRAIAEHGARAMEAARALCGGSAYYRTSPLERIDRDFRAISLHPLTPEQTLFHAGRFALGLDAESA